MDLHALLTLRQLLLEHLAHGHLSDLDLLSHHFVRGIRDDLPRLIYDLLLELCLQRLYLLVEVIARQELIVEARGDLILLLALVV